MDRRLFSAPQSWQAMRDGFSWDIPETMNIARLCCDDWAGVAANQVAVIHLDGQGGRQCWTYGQLKRASDGLAVALAARGVRRGDRVAILLAQHPFVLISHFAAMKLGAVALPLFTLFGEDALRYRLSDSGARVVMTDPTNLDRVMAMQPDLPALDLVISTAPARAPILALPDLIETPARGFRPVLTGADDPAMMIYTSGTTGDPKGVLHAHRFLIGHLPCIELSQSLFPKPGDIGWTPADWAWIGGLMDMAMPCLYYGVPLVSHRFAKFDPEAALALMAREGVSNAFIPPTALRLMREAVPRPKELRLRAVSSGGEPLGADLLDWGRDVLRAGINELYGQTEANLLVASCSVGMDRVPGAMGLPVPGHDVRVLDEAGCEVGENEVGEVCVKMPDPVAFLRYWNKPEATAQKVVDGWLRTGDLAWRRGDGQLVFHARDDDVITSSGYRIGPAEIEAALLGHRDVVMAAVVGEPDRLRTEIVVAHVVLREGAEWEGIETALKELVRDRVSAHLVPRRVVRAESLPMTATGKVMRRALRGG
jgi:acetyl-CoA synthetase